jgi:hypothetical protein
VPGYPIRTPWDHSSVDSSPRPIAASHVLHRLLVPRHPPYALTNLTTQQPKCWRPKRNKRNYAKRTAYNTCAITTNLKMLASTVQFSTNTKPQPLHSRDPPTSHQRYPRPAGIQSKQPTRCWLFQDPTGCLHAPHQPHHQPALHAPDLTIRCSTSVGGRCRPGNFHQCLRHRAPHGDIRTVWAPHPRYGG